MPAKSGMKQITRMKENSMPLRVLILGENATESQILESELQKQWSNIQCRQIDRREEYESALSKDEWDLILSGHHLQELNSLQAYAILQDSFSPNIPFIIVSNNLKEETILKALNIGVKNYLRIDDLSRLIPTVDRLIMEYRYQQKNTQIQLRQEFLIQLLELLNSKRNIDQLYQDIVDRIREFGDFAAVGLRIKEQDSFPFKALSGFSQKECDISDIDSKNESANNIYNCLCGKVLQGATTQTTSENKTAFWFNDKEELSKYIYTGSNTPPNRQRCLKEGYHSVAVIPIRQNSTAVGLLHLSSLKRGVFDQELVDYYEKIGNIIGLANSRSVMEHNLWQQSEFVHRLMEHSTNIHFTRTMDYRFSFVSEQVIDLLGYSPEDVYDNWQRLISDNPINKYGLKLAKKVMRTGKYQAPYELELLDRKGNKILVEVRETPIVEKGKIIQIVGSITDISKLKKSERELLERDRQYNNLVNKAKVGIAEDDIEGNIVYCNEEFSKIFGYSKKEITNEIYKSIVHPDDREKINFYHQRHIKGKGNNDRYEIKGLRKKGGIVYLDVSVDILRNAKGIITGTRSYLWDITLRKQSELLLQTVYNISRATHQSEDTAGLFIHIRQLLSEVMDTTNIFIALYDKPTDKLWIPLSADSEDDIQYFPAGKTLSKYVIQKEKALLLYEEDMDELTEKKIIDMVGKPSKVWLGAPLKYQDEIMGVIVVQSYDDPDLYSQRDLDILEYVSDEIASALKHSQKDDELKKAYSELKEIHENLKIEVNKTVDELRKKDAELELRSRQAAIGEMISRLAHNWRQPLNIISVIVQSLKDAWDYGELTDDFMQLKMVTCIKEVKKLSKQIDELRFFYQSNREKGIFDIKKAVIEVIDLNKNRFNNNNINLSTIFNDDCQIDGYVKEFQQVLSNLLSNAFNILIDRKIEHPQVNIKLLCDSDFVILSVSDNGGGVKKELEDIIFELYTSTKKELNNSGIGLYLSRFYIENHMGGKISLINHPDGAEFVVKLPKLR